MKPTTRWIWAMSQSIPSSPKAVLVALAYYANAQTLIAYPAVETLEAHTSLSRRTVQRALGQLREANLIQPFVSDEGWLERSQGEQGWPGPVKYRVCIPPGWETQATHHRPLVVD